MANWTWGLALLPEKFRQAYCPGPLKGMIPLVDCRNLVDFLVVTGLGHKIGTPPYFESLLNLFVISKKKSLAAELNYSICTIIIGEALRYELRRKKFLDDIASHLHEYDIGTV